MAGKRQIKLGLSMRGLGYHASAWQLPEMDAGGGMSFDFYRSITQTAQRGLFDMVFLADYLGVSLHDNPKGLFGRNDSSITLEPLTLLAALSAVTQNIGLVCTTSSTFQEPYHIARMFASLDHLSGGRAAWNVVTSFQGEEADNFSARGLPPKDQRYERAREAVQVVTGLWASWEADAFPRDKASGVFFDPAKMHPINHAGKHFQVKGPLNIPRTPQGRPIVVQAGASEEGQELAAETADLVYAAQNDLGQAKAAYRGLKDRMPKFGRDPDDLKIMPGLLAVVGETMDEAEAKYRAMKDTLDPVIGMSYLAHIFGDMSGYHFDDPVPDELPMPAFMSRAHIILDLAKRNNYTMKQLYEYIAIGNAHNVVVGTPAMIADVMEEWMEEEAADGFNILPALLPSSIEEFVDMVVPEIQRRGIYRTAYESTTMRGNLGLPDPA